jgi:hypothetical protein
MQFDSLGSLNRYLAKIISIGKFFNLPDEPQIKSVMAFFDGASLYFAAKTLFR